MKQPIQHTTSGAMVLSLVMVHIGKRVLLGMKKRGFGAGRWNGFGGKVHTNESIEESAARELREEALITAKDLTPVGILTFTFVATGEVLEVHVFRCTAFDGKPKETDEMKPQWFSVDEIPYNDMWSDDIHWLPLVLDGKLVQASFSFGAGDALLDQKVHIVDHL